MGSKSLKRQREPAQKEVDSAVPPKRRRQAEDIQLAKLYDELAAESDETRMRAAKQIIVSFSPENKPSAQAIEKALIRLIRGLCSTRKAARFGFCVTLTELLRLFFGQQKNAIDGLDLDVNGVIDMVVENTKVEGNVPGKVRELILLRLG
jgi:DNA polymerase phi